MGKREVPFILCILVALSLIVIAAPDALASPTAPGCYGPTDLDGVIGCGVDGTFTCDAATSCYRFRPCNCGGGSCGLPGTYCLNGPYCQAKTNLYFDRDGDGHYASGNVNGYNVLYDCYDIYSGFSYSPGDDCNDTDPSVHPGAKEVCGNGKDDDCDGNQPATCWTYGLTYSTSGCANYQDNAVTLDQNSIGCDDAAVNDQQNPFGVGTVWPVSCYGGYEFSTTPGSQNWAGPDPTDTAYDLNAGASFGAKLVMHPALNPEASLLPQAYAIGCQPTAGVMNYQCGDSTGGSTSYRNGPFNNYGWTCSRSGQYAQGPCWNYFCGSNKAAYTCSNDPQGYDVSDGNCRARKTFACAGDFNCQGSLTCHTLNRNSPPSAQNPGRCCADGEYNDGSKCTGLALDCNSGCATAIWGNPSWYVLNCANSGARTACAQYNPPKYGPSTAYEYRAYQVLF